jgi:osmoprotectant transport system permease protein
VLLALPLLATLYLLPRATGRLQAGFSPEFVGRADGLPGLTSAYGLRRLPSVVLAPALVYEAARNAHVDVIDGYSTDGRIKAYDLQVLTDDRRVFPPYYAAPVVRAGLLTAHPELRTVFGKLAGQLSDSVMTELNYHVDYLHEEPRAVAQSFLRRGGLWRAPRPLAPGAATVTVGSKIFSEQYLLAEMYASLIRGYTTLDVQTKTGLGGTTICFEALRSGAIDMYPEYTGTGLLVLLQPAPAVVDSLGGDAGAVLRYVRAEFQRRYGMEWLAPLGFNNTYSLLMRRQQATQLGIASISDLGTYLRQ